MTSIIITLCIVCTIIMASSLGDLAAYEINYGSNSSEHLLKMRGAFSVPLWRGNINTNDPINRPMAYYTIIGFGTPAKQFNIQFDTRTSETWIPHYEYSWYNNLHFGKGYRAKDSSTSTRENKRFKIVHKNVEMKANGYSDIISFGYRQRFLAITDVADATFKYAPFDGVVGLAPVAKSQTGTVPMLIRLRETGVIQYTVFSIFINPMLDSTNGGEITFGGVNQNRYTGQIYFHSLVGWAFDWAIQVRGVRINQRVISCQQGCVAYIDTGLNDMTWGPHSDVVVLMNDYLHAKFDAALNLYTIDCSSVPGLPPLAFVIDSIEYVMLPTNYARLTRNPNTHEVKCYITIRASNQQNWILGNNFLGAYYTIFDMDRKQVGFATMKV